jgi:hypothetical protein
MHEGAAASTALSGWAEPLRRSRRGGEAVTSSRGQADMIVALRSAVPCEQVVTRDDGRTDYLGILGEELQAESRPGVVELWITLHLELDAQHTRGIVRLHAADYLLTFAYEVPEGWLLAIMTIPIAAPVIEEGPLIVDIYDEAQQETPFRAAWSLSFAPGARVLGAAEGRRLIAAARAASAAAVADLGGKLATRH